MRPSLPAGFVSVPSVSLWFNSSLDAERGREGAYLLTIRPEALRLGPGENSREARVTALTFLGSQTRVELEVEGVTLQSLTSPDATRSLQPGTRITVALPPEALWLLPPD